MSFLGQNEIPELSEKPFKEIKGIAKNALRLGDTYTALFYYVEWATRKVDDASISYQVAELYRATRNYKEAENWYLKVKEIDPNGFVEGTFYLAQMQMSQGKYAEAKKNLEGFKRNAKDLKDPKYFKLTKSGIKSCDFAISHKDSSNTAVVEHLDNSINQPHVEFSPIIMDENTLVYGSLKEDGVNYYDVSLHDSLKIPLRKFYVAKKKDNEWKAEGELEGPFNEEGSQIGNGTLSANGSRFYFTRCKKNWMNKMICELFYSDLKNGEWQEEIRLNDLINMPNFTTTQPAIGRESKKNREIIYFVSDRPGGKGGLDIWYTEYDKRKDRYKPPKNAGAKINSAGTEFTPFYDIPTHKLYYSSDGKTGFGGLDIYKADGEKSRWEPPINMGNEINSPADDLDFVLEDSNQGGFLVTNREGGSVLLNPTCCDDIYAFKFAEYIEIDLKGLVMDSLEHLSDYNLNIYINYGLDITVDNKELKERYLAQQLSIDESRFSVQLEQGYSYTVEVTKEGYLNGSVDVSTVGITTSQTINEKINLSKIPAEPMVLKGILYEFNSADLTANAKTTIDTTLYKILIDNPNIIVQIASHTDSKGTDSYNLSLSKKRAKSVVNYLLKLGIDKKRLTSQGFGESKPIAANQHADGSDNPEGRQLNRRTDFQIVGKVKQEIIEEEW